MAACWDSFWRPRKDDRLSQPHLVLIQQPSGIGNQDLRIQSSPLSIKQTPDIMKIKWLKMHIYIKICPHLFPSLFPWNDLSQKAEMCHSPPSPHLLHHQYYEINKLRDGINVVLENCVKHRHDWPNGLPLCTSSLYSLSLDRTKNSCLQTVCTSGSSNRLVTWIRLKADPHRAAWPLIFQVSLSSYTSKIFSETKVCF